MRAAPLLGRLDARGGDAPTTARIGASGKRSARTKDDTRWKKWPILAACGVLLLLVVGVVLLVSGAFGEGPREKRGDSPPGGTTTPSPWTPAGQAVGVQPSPLDCTKDGVSATAVRQAQQAWAQYLGRQVEEEDEIAPGVKMKFVLIPPGTFQMGSPTGESERSTNEAPHEVELRYPFYLGANDVTVGEFRRFVDATKYKTEAESDGKGGYGGDPDKGTFTQDPKYTLAHSRLFSERGRPGGGGVVERRREIHRMGEWKRAGWTLVPLAARGGMGILLSGRAFFFPCLRCWGRYDSFHAQREFLRFQPQ